jgi:hypothetical protein
LVGHQEKELGREEFKSRIVTIIVGFRKGIQSVTNFPNFLSGN